jgi:hypothetical protein
VVDHHFRTQHGLVTRAQCLAAGMTPRQIDSLLLSGAWVLVGRGVYRSAAVAVTFEQRALAACLCAGPAAVASHTTAAVLHRLEGVRPGRIEITIVHTARREVHGVRVHRARHLDPHDRVVISGIPVTSVGRTLVDVATRVTESALTEAIDGAICGRLITPDALRRAADRAGRRPGKAALGEALALWEPGPIPGSVAEVRLLRRLVEFGFPRPVLQHEIHDRGQFVARVDFAYPESRVALEYDGRRRHLDPNHRRANAVRAAGWQLLTADAADLRGHTPFYRELARLLP